MRFVPEAVGGGSRYGMLARVRVVNAAVGQRDRSNLAQHRLVVIKASLSSTDLIGGPWS